MEPSLDQLSVAVSAAKTLEEMSRPLLDMLAAVTGMESAFLTTVDWKRDVLQVLYARNHGEMQISEGISAPWDDTLCRRAIGENLPFADDVDTRWADSRIGRELKIRTYLSMPVRLADGELFGTLCAASHEHHALAPQTQHMFTLLATLIAQQVERERLMQQLVQANARLMVYASTDPLTQLLNRRALQEALARLLDLGARRNVAVLVAFVDLDGFKAINDTHGHEVGDQFLVTLAGRLRGLLRSEDIAARLGGDEFAVVALGPAQLEQLPDAERAFQQRVFEATRGDYQLEGLKLHYAGASVGVLGVAPGRCNALQALQAADAAMYRIKQQRKNQRSTA